MYWFISSQVDKGLQRVTLFSGSMKTSLSSILALERGPLLSVDDKSSIYYNYGSQGVDVVQSYRVVDI